MYDGLATNSSAQTAAIIPFKRVWHRLTSMNFDRRYWILIAAAIFCATLASASTLYLASVQEHFMECNSTSAACFAAIGMVPCMALGVLAFEKFFRLVSDDACYI